MESKGGNLFMKWFNKIPTSKKYAWIVILAYFLEVGFTMYAMYINQIDLSGILVYTTPLVTLTLTSYYAKAGAENVTSIKQSNNQEDVQG
jgi:hypothetical protein